MPSPSLIWFLAGTVFLIAELAVPGFILIFFTMGCWIAAIFAGVTDISLSGQIAVFIVSSIVCIVLLRKYLLKIFKGKTADDIDDDYSHATIGKTAEVTQAIKPHTAGEIKVMGSFWRAIADEEIDAGQSVIIESRASEDGLTFKVKPI